MLNGMMQPAWAVITKAYVVQDTVRHHPLFAAAVAAAAVAVLLLVVTASRHRRHAGRADARLCRTCGMPHPAFARFCRRCGRFLLPGREWN